MNALRGSVASLTGLRGVAALWVATFHFVVSLPDYQIAGRFGISTLIGHGYLAVDVFFILSGFVMALSYSHFFEHGLLGSRIGIFLVRRAARIYPLYIAVTLLYIAEITVRQGFGPFLGSQKMALITNILMVQSWGFGSSIVDQGWSISAELAAYILFPFIATGMIFSASRSAWIAAVLCIFGLAVLGLAPISTEYRRMGLFDIHPDHTAFPILRCLSGFGLGVLTYRVAVFARQHGHRTAPYWCYAATALLLLVQMTPGYDFISLLITPVFIFTLLGENAVAGVLGSQVMIFLGEVSYAVYLVHGKVFPKVHGVTEAWLLPALGKEGMAAASYAACITLTIGIAYLAHRLVERPARRWIRGLESAFDPSAERQVQSSEALGLSDITK